MKRASTVVGFGLIFCLILATHLFEPAPIQGRALQTEDQQERESRADYHKQWLDQDVIWIISDEERSVFSKLSSNEEKDQFIEQFWLRRDPDPRTRNNEFKEEHYRRIAYANEHYTSGAPGWRTDRGRVYIIHGPPNQKEKFTYGQSYERKFNEGGGRTSTLPFERWWYRRIEGMGMDIELEFVDRTGSGEFRLTLNNWEKDALFYTMGGQTLAESEGRMSRSDHPAFKPWNRETYPFVVDSHKDNPFIRYETLTMATAAPIVKYKDLKDLVSVSVRYNELPVRIRQDFFQLNEGQMLVPITIQLENSDLTFEVESGLHVARVAVVGMITSMTNRLITEFEDDLILSYPPELFEQALNNRAVYQKTVPLSRSNRYKLDILVQDLNSNVMGSTQQGIHLPAHEGERLSTSTLILADYVTSLPELAAPDEMFVIGDVKVRPHVTRVFNGNDRCWVYLHLYNAGFDQASSNPKLVTSYQVLKNGREVLSTTDDRGRSIQFFSGRRAVLIKEVPIRNLKPGKYEIRVGVKDEIGGEQVSVKDTFVVRDK